MNLLATMLGFNPFAPQLPSTAFAQSLKEYEAKLAAMKPPEPAEEEEEARPETIEEGDEEKPADEEKDPDEEKDAEEDAPVPAEEPTPSAPELDGGLEAVRTMVAALKTALGFAVQMSGAVGVLCRCSRPPPLGRHRGHRPSRPPSPVRRRRRGRGCSPHARAGLLPRHRRPRRRRGGCGRALPRGRRLAGCRRRRRLPTCRRRPALGELAALEEVIKRLVADGRVPPTGAVIRALWAQATAKELPDESRAPRRSPSSRWPRRTHRSAAAGVDHAAAALGRACRCKSGVLARAAAALLARASGRERRAVKIGRRRRARARARRAVVCRVGKGALAASTLPGRAWYPRRGAVHRRALRPHPDPEGAASDVVRSFATAAFPAEDHASSNVRRRDPARDFSLCSARWACAHLVHVEKDWLARCAARASPAIARLPRMPRRRPRTGETHGEEAAARGGARSGRGGGGCASRRRQGTLRRSFSACRGRGCRARPRRRLRARGGGAVWTPRGGHRASVASRRGARGALATDGD